METLRAVTPNTFIVCGTLGKDISMSLHTYGRHINYTGRSEFDLENKREKPYAIKISL